MKKTINVISIIEDNRITGVQYGTKPVNIMQLNETDEKKLHNVSVTKSVKAYKNLKANIIHHRKNKSK